MRIEKNELAQKINKLKQVVPKRTPMAVLQGILVSDGYLIANNMELAIKAKVEGTDEEPFMIPMKAFDLINNLPDGMVEIIPEHKGEVYSITIKADKIKNKYQTMSPSDFPLPNVGGAGGGEFTIRADRLLTSMRRVSYAIPLNNANSTMSTLCLQAAGGTLNFVGLDGHVLAWDKVDFDGEFELLIPKGTVDRLLSIGIIGEVSIRHNENGATFATDEYEIHTRIVSGEYFKYAGMFKDLPMHTVIAKSELLDAMVRAKMCTEEKSPARFTLKGSELNIAIKDTTTDYHETINLQEDISEELAIGFDARLVIETLKAFDCDNVAINLESAKMPMIIEAEDSDFKAMVLPVAIH